MLSSKVREELRGDLPDYNEFDKLSRELKIQFFWKIFHALYWVNFGNLFTKSLEEVSKLFIQRAWLELLPVWDTLVSIDKFKQNWKWIILLDHTQFANFSDYLPLFALLEDDILKKCVFYTWSYNLKMNQEEFPDYKFRWAIPIDKKDVKRLTSEINEDIERINKEWWYIFVIPSWAWNTKHWDFRAIAKRFIDWLWDNSMVLASKVSRGFSYKNIAKSSIVWKLWKVEINWITSSISDWKWKTGQEMRENYESMFI